MSDVIRHLAREYFPESEERAARCEAALLRAQQVQRDETKEAFRVILAAVRGDEKGECWTIRRYLNERDVYNGDIQSNLRLVEQVCKHVLATLRSQEIP